MASLPFLVAVVEVKPPFVFVDNTPIPVDLKAFDFTTSEIVADCLSTEARNLRCLLDADQFLFHGFPLSRFGCEATARSLSRTKYVSTHPSPFADI